MFAFALKNFKTNILKIKGKNQQYPHIFTYTPLSKKKLCVFCALLNNFETIVASLFRDGEIKKSIKKVSLYFFSVCDGDRLIIKKFHFLWKCDFCGNFLTFSIFKEKNSS